VFHGFDWIQKLVFLWEVLMGFKLVFGIALTLDFNEILMDLIGFSCFFSCFVGDIMESSNVV
jgi:hypothetical protein